MNQNFLFAFVQNRRDTTRPNGKLLDHGFKVLFEGQNCMFGLNKHIFNQKIKQKSNCLVISGSSLYFFNRCSKFFGQKRPHNSFLIREEMTQRQQDTWKLKLNSSIFRTKWIVLPYSESFSEGTYYNEAKLHNFPVNKNTVKRLAFGNAFESSIIF